MSALGQALSMALMMYTGEHCRFCNRVFATVQSLEEANAVFAGYVTPDDGTRVACKACWEAQRGVKKTKRRESLERYRDALVAALEAMPAGYPGATADRAVFCAGVEQSLYILNGRLKVEDT